MKVVEVVDDSPIGNVKRSILCEEGSTFIKPIGEVEMLYKNQVLLEKFLESRRLSRKTRINYLMSLSCFSKIVGSIEDSGRREFEEWYRRVDSGGYKASTILLYTSHLSQLLRFALMSRGLSRREIEDRVAVAMEGVPLEDLRREESRSPYRDKLVSDEEFEALMEAARHPRVKALVSVLRESGCRKGEVLSLRIRHIEFLPTHVEIKVLGKTGERTIPLVRSLTHLRRWLDVHPDQRKGSPLFATMINGEVKRMGKDTPNHILKDLCDRAGVRHIYPHMLRHTRLTELARAGLGEYQLKSFAGWSPSSNMAARYIHLTGRAHVDAILRVEGVRYFEGKRD